MAGWAVRVPVSQIRTHVWTLERHHRFQMWSWVKEQGSKVMLLPWQQWSLRPQKELQIVWLLYFSSYLYNSCICRRYVCVCNGGIWRRRRSVCRQNRLQRIMWKVKTLWNVRWKRKNRLDMLGGKGRRDFWNTMWKKKKRHWHIRWKWKYNLAY